MNAPMDFRPPDLGPLNDAAAGCEKCGRFVLSCGGLGGEVADAGGGTACELCSHRLDQISPCLESVAAAMWFCAGPCAFPLVFLFPDQPAAAGATWRVPMVEAPMKQPLVCAGAACVPCAQYYVRLRVLDGDISKYKLFQGRADGPHCCAHIWPSAPITIKSGTYGDSGSSAWLCAESCLCPCCAFEVSRAVMKQERGLADDPTEVRYRHCQHFFGMAAASCAQLGCCVKCMGCLVGCCAPENAGAQSLEDSAYRAGNGCLRIAHLLHRGLWAVRLVAVGCMSAQIVHESFGKGGPAVYDASTPPAKPSSAEPPPPPPVRDPASGLFRPTAPAPQQISDRA